MKYSDDFKRDTFLDFPRYINNQPIGEDYFEGKSQEKVASSIATHILETDNRKESYFPRLIGIEGKRGSGKSNVLKIVENKLKNDYIVYRQLGGHP